MKRIKKAIAVVALLFAAGSLWADFDAESKEYQAYWFEAAQKHKNDVVGYFKALNDFSNSHPQCILPFIDIADLLYGNGDRLGGDKYYFKANKLAKKAPNTEEGKFAKAKFYKLAMLKDLYFSDGASLSFSEASAAINAQKCAELNEQMGTQAYYSLARYYAFQKEHDQSIAKKYYDIAFNMDRESNLSSDRDITFYLVNFSKSAPKDTIQLVEKIISEKKRPYTKSFGTFAMNSYEKDKQKEKAVLVSMVDAEFSFSISKQNIYSYIALLNKNFGKDKKLEPCLSFIRKFYDKNEALGEADLAALPEGEKDFFTVRYMYAMKNSDDIAAIRSEFEPFFKGIPQFYSRLYEKAQKIGDKKAMDELGEILKKK